MEKKSSTPPNQTMDFSKDPLNISGVVGKPEKNQSKPSRAKDVARRQSTMEGTKSSGSNITNQGDKTPESTTAVTTPQVKPDSDLSYILAGATPLLTGFLMGETGIGASVAGDTVLGMNQNEIEANKARISHLRKVAGSKESAAGKRRYRIANVERDGKTYQEVFDSFTGEYKPTDKLSGYRQNVKTDPTTGELVKFTGSGDLENIRGIEKNKYTVKQEKELTELRDKIINDKKFSTARSTVSAAGRAQALLQSKNPISDEGIKTIFPRMFGEVGNLAAAEQNRFAGSPEFSRMFDRLKEKRFTSGNITNEDRRDLLEVSRVMKLYAESNLKRSAGAYIKSSNNIRGYDANTVIEPFLNEGTPAPAGIQNRAERSDPTRNKPRRVKQGGRIYELDATGEYIEVEN